jgi:hypothetical protein
MRLSLIVQLLHCKPCIFVCFVISPGSRGATYGPLYGSCINVAVLFIQRRVSLSPHSMKMVCSFAWGIIETATIYSYNGSHKQPYNTPFNLLHCAGKNNITTYGAPQPSSRCKILRSWSLLNRFSRSTCNADRLQNIVRGRPEEIRPAIMGVDLGISLFTSAGILLFLSLLAVTLRCITRIYIVKAFGLDDWLMIVAMVRTPKLAYLGRSQC